jgi:hypothetical protein
VGTLCTSARSRFEVGVLRAGRETAGSRGAEGREENAGAGGAPLKRLSSQGIRLRVWTYAIRPRYFRKNSARRDHS